MFEDEQFGHPAFAGAGWERHGAEPWQPWARGPRGFGFGPFHRPHFGHGLWRMFGFGFGGRRGPQAFGRGDLKYALLELLRERPMHGYEMMKALEERAGGFYTPSAGAIYPTLQLMEDRGWVTSQTVDARKVYTLTDAGRQALTEQSAQERPAGPWQRHHGPWHGPRGPFSPHHTPALASLRMEGMEVARLMRDAVIATQGDPARLSELQGIVHQTREALQRFISQGQQTPPPASGPIEQA
jgi:DNA-binding PadR family transcriptional regulator